MAKKAHVSKTISRLPVKWIITRINFCIVSQVLAGNTFCMIEDVINSLDNRKNVVSILCEMNKYKKIVHKNKELHEKLSNKK